MGNIIHTLTNADFTAYTYNQIFSTQSVAVTLNGTNITLAPPMKLDIKVTSCESASPDSVILIGMLSFNANGGGPIDIKTGKPFLTE